MIELEGEGMRDKTCVVIEEVKNGDLVIGGKIPKIQTGKRNNYNRCEELVLDFSPFLFLKQ